MRISFVAAPLALLFLLSCQPAPSGPVPKTQQQQIFTTVIQLTFYGDAPDSTFTQIFDRLRRIDTLMSDYDANSEISRLSGQAGETPMAVSPETLTVVHTALSEAALTNGIFDPTIGPITHLWDISGQAAQTVPKLPSADEISKARALVNWKNVVVDDAKSTILLKQKGMRVDLGGVAKGFAMDEALRIARQAGIKSGILNMGNSSIALLGKKPGGTAWKVGIQDPFQTVGTPFAVVSGSDMTVETSGTYQKFFMLNGHRYHHIMDPRTGAPAESGLEQVTLLLPLDTKLADGLSTSCFILGLDQGMKLIESLPDAAAIFVTSDKRVYLSSRIGDRFTLKDTSFHVSSADSVR
jgi:thiamine biosynthesis lipoprotein